MDRSSERNTNSEESFEASILHCKELQKVYEAKEQYDEAEKLELRIQELREKRRKKEVSKLRRDQRSERKSINSIYKNELKQFKNRWEVSIRNCIDNFQTQEEELKRRHKQLYEIEKDYLEKNSPSIFKPSAQLLNLIKCKEKAVISKKYREAQNLASVIGKSTEYEEKDFTEQRDLKIKKQLSIFQKKLNKEIEVIRFKHEVELRELNKLRDLGKDSMEKKVENINRELENAQNIQIHMVKGLHSNNTGCRSPQRPSSSFRSEHPTPIKLIAHKKSSNP